MKGRLFVVFAAFCAVSARAQEKPVFQATVSLVQLDVVATDKHGEPVTDLSASDFEIFEDGQPQEVVHCRYVTTDAAPAAPPSGSRGAAPPLRPEDTRRTMVVVVDDLQQSPDSIIETRDAVRKFIEDQVQPGDLVALLRTSSGTGTLQKFTTDKRVLRAAIDSVRFQFGGAFAAPKAVAFDIALGQADDARRDSFDLGALATLRSALEALARMPGRKSIVLFSDGLVLFPDPGGALGPHALADLANRASVVIYTIDSHGLSFLRPPRSDLRWLADQTGGLSYRNTSVETSLERVVRDQRGYYLVGFAPPPSTFALRKGRPVFHKLRVRATRPGIRVRSRTGFVGLQDEERPAPSQRPSLVELLASPFAAQDVLLSLTAQFFHTSGRSAVHSILHVDAKDLTFTDAPGGSRQVEVEVLGMALDESGEPVGRTGKTQTIRLTPEGEKKVRERGLVYEMSIRVKKAGAHELRFAFRDVASGSAGSARQFVMVPKVKGKHLALSGIVMGTAFSPSEAEADREATQVLRRFRSGSTVSYQLTAYNTRVPRDSPRPRLETQVRLSREGREVLRTEWKPLEAATRSEPGLAEVGGTFQLGPMTVPGDYVLEVSVNDTLAGTPHGTATQAIDFEVTAPEP